MLRKDTHIGLLAPITWDIPPLTYGPWEKVVYNLARGLVARGYKKVTLFATKQAHIRGIKTISVFNEPLRDQFKDDAKARELLHISAAIEYANKNCDLLHAHINYYPLLFSHLMKIPVLTTLHGSGSEIASQIAYRRFKEMPFISISESERRFIPELNYIATIPNPIDFKEFSLGAIRTPKYLVFTGRVHPDKGVHQAVELAEKLGLPLYIAGPLKNEQAEYFRKHIQPALDAKKAFYLGNLSPKKIHKLVSGALAFIALIEWEEPFGLSIAEAMASGTPVIGTPRGSQKELIIDGVTGILVDSVSDAVHRFPAVTSINRKECRRVAQKHFDTDIVTSAYLAAYERILK